MDEGGCRSPACTPTQRRCLVLEPVCATELLLQGCQLTQYTEGYTKTLLKLARKVRVGAGVHPQSRPNFLDAVQYPDGVSSCEPLTTASWLNRLRAVNFGGFTCYLFLPPVFFELFDGKISEPHLEHRWWKIGTTSSGTAARDDCLESDFRLESPATHRMLSNHVYFSSLHSNSSKRIPPIFSCLSVPHNPALRKNTFDPFPVYAVVW